MQFGVYIYKQYDTDILSLADAGYDVTRMMKEAVTGYANNRPVHFFIDRLVSFDVNGKKSIRVMVNVPKSDKKTLYMLQHIKDRYRGRFCKAVLRNALIQQNICCYFADENLMQLQNDNLAFMNLSAFTNLKPISAYIKQQKLKVNDKVITIDAKQEKTDFYGGAFANLEKSDNQSVPVKNTRQPKPFVSATTVTDEIRTNPAVAPANPQPASSQQAMPDLAAMMQNPEFMAQMMQMFSAMQSANESVSAPGTAMNINNDNNADDSPVDDDNAGITLADNDALLDAFSNI